MRRLGVHTSIAGGLHLSLERADALCCSTMQIFSHNPRGWALKPLCETEIIRFKGLRAALKISPVCIHTSYLINIASRDAVLRRNSVEMLVTEMDRADQIGAEYVILHTGSASGDDPGVARDRAVITLKEVAEKGRWRAGLLIENTAGERGDISSSVGDIAEIMGGAGVELIAGLCIDTCHAFAAGYDIRSIEGIENLSGEIKEYLGSDKIKLIHLNDSRGDCGSHADRHEHIGLGKIGMKALHRIVHWPVFREVPLILETPKKNISDDAVNLEKVRMMIMKRQFHNMERLFLK